MIRKEDIKKTEEIQREWHKKLVHVRGREIYYIITER